MVDWTFRAAIVISALVFDDDVKSQLKVTNNIAINAMIIPLL
jgi:hypothetical protein